MPNFGSSLGYLLSRCTKSPSLFHETICLQVTGENCTLLTDAIERYSYVYKNHLRLHRGRRARERRKRRNGAILHDANFQGRIEELRVELTSACEIYPHFEMDESCEYALSSNLSRYMKNP